MSNFKLNWRGDLAKKIAKEAALSAIHDGALHILSEAVDEAPVDTGDLRGSGKVEDMPEEQATVISFNEPYALRQHEELNYNHPKGGKAKYLEDPFNRNISKVNKLIKDRVKTALQKER